MSESLVKGFLERKLNDSQFEIFEESLFGKSKSNGGKTRTLNEYESKVIDLVDDGLCDFIENERAKSETTFYCKHIGKEIPCPKGLFSTLTRFRIRSNIYVDTKVNKRTGIELTKVKYGHTPASFTRCKLNKG